MFVSMFSFVLGCVDQLLNIVYATMFYLWMPRELQRVILLGIFVISVIHLGEMPSLQSVMRDFKSRLRQKRTRKFHRRRLPYHLVMRCRRRQSNRPWVIDHESFLRPDKVQPAVVQPFSDEMLEAFCSAGHFLGPTQLAKGFDREDHSAVAQATVDRMNSHRVNLLLEAQHGIFKLRTSFIDCPLVWDTGASYGLTPFRGDFIDYEECSIPVQDISKTNMVVGIGTVMWKFKESNGGTIYLPLLCYHLPTADIRLLSPQTYHQLHGGDSHLIDNGSAVEMRMAQQSPEMPAHRLRIPIDMGGTNLPVVHGVSCTDYERENIGPRLRSALARHELAFQDRWEQARTAATRQKLGFNRKWSQDKLRFEYEFAQTQAMCCPCVGDDSNENLTGPQRELLLWHWKLGVSMSRIQQMMVEHEAVDMNNESVIMPQVIKPRYKTTSSCPIPLCAACELARAKKRNPKVVRQKAIAEKEGILAANEYMPGDFVSMDQFVVRTPGRLPTGFGREAKSNRYHGGTIFNDASTGIIWVENQVSLGAFETISSKTRFEEWLWELACVEIKQYRSDNGVFTAEEFREDCRNKGQRQSFSGVGAQHQNARAERAIQTIMYMARTFMLHVALHWSNNQVDDISLWPFAVKHAVWLYNRMPNHVTGITPLERLTNTKADHKDLLRSHVWGCPTFVLDARLQDGKKIPKWNKRSRLGQFLGYSDEHSSLVANVRHLTTGHVSPQYHVVFDELFQTVFSSGENDAVVDAISNLLWDNNRELYVEQEFDENGNLIYQPPPLDEVWLSEPERRERKDRLRQQRVRRSEREKRIVDAIPKDIETRPREGRRQSRDSSPPGLASSSADDDSVTDSSTLGVVQESEGEMWDDHPSVITKRAEPEPEPVAPPIPSVVEEDPVRTSEGADGGSPARAEQPVEPKPRRKKDAEPEWRRDTDGRLKRRKFNFSKMNQQEFRQTKSNMSKRDKVKHFASLCAQMPARACRLSRKKRKYRQRMAHLRTEGDKYLNEMRFDDEENPITVNTLLNSPLAKFIHLAANDCGYKGTVKELVCNWVHPLFLKAKAAASKQDNPNWWQAMDSEFAEEFWKAAVTEIETLEAMGAWEVVDKTDEMNVIDSTWAFKIKRYPDGLIKKFKGRFCARGDQQIEGIDFFETYAPVVQWTTVRLMLILEVLLDLKSKQGDVTAAFLHADLEEGEEVYVRMPRGFQKKGKVLKLKKTLYGLRQSPRAFWKYMVQKMEACGMPQSKLDPCLFVGEKVICVCFVDDLLFWARDAEDIHKLAIRLREQGVDLEQEDDAAGFLGVRLERNNETNLLEMKQTGLIERIIEALGLDVGTVNGKATPAEGRPLVKDENGLDAKREFNYASVVGMLLYLAGHSRPDIAYAVNCAARYMFNAKRSHEEALKRIGRYLKATRDKGLVLNPSPDGVLKIDNYPDADFAGMYGHEEPTDPASVKSRTGYVITVADCPVHWQSKLQTETALSTMEAEIVALAHSCRELFPIMDIVASIGPELGLEVGDTSMNVSIHEDNAGALILAETLPPQYTPRSKHYAIKTVWFREAIVKRGIKLVKIDTIEQLGDIFTKSLPRVTFEYLRKKLMGW